MATGLAAKRMAKERKDLEKENPDYFVVFNDDDLLKFDAYVVGPEDSLYRHKLVKLHFEIPREYPMKPPTVKFVQHTGERIHPNLYVDGKVCLSILGTWQGEPWAYSMTVSQLTRLLNQPSHPNTCTYTYTYIYVLVLTSIAIWVSYVPRK